MKAKHLLIGLFSSLFLLAGCTNDQSLNQWWPLGHADKMMAKTNGDILGELIAVDKAEMSIADVGKMRAQQAKVKKFAAYLHQGHSKNLHKVMSVSRTTGIAPVMDSKATMIQNKSQEEVARLKALDKRAFDKEFIATVIHCHEKALMLLDRDIMLSTNDQITKLLKETRNHVDEHLQKARMLHKEMM